MFDTIFRTLSEGDAAVPAAGMGAIPRQMAARLDPRTIHLDARSSGSNRDGSRWPGDEGISADRIIVATEGPAASQLLGLRTGRIAAGDLRVVRLPNDHPPTPGSSCSTGPGRSGAQRGRDEQRRPRVRPRRVGPDRRSLPRSRRCVDRARRPSAAPRLVGGPGRRLAPSAHARHPPRTTATSARRSHRSSG